MCRFTTLAEYLAHGDNATTWCMCKGQQDATWECVRYWLETKLLPQSKEEAFPRHEDTKFKYNHQFMPYKSQSTKPKDATCWYAIPTTELKRFPRGEHKKCLTLYADVNVNQFCAHGAIITYHNGPYIQAPPNLESYFRDSTRSAPSMVQYFNARQELQNQGLSEDDRLQLIMRCTYLRYVEEPNKTHPSDYAGPYAGLLSDCGEVMEYFPVVDKNKDGNKKSAPLGIPRTQLEIVQTEEQAEFVEWKVPPPGSGQKPYKLFTRRRILN